MSNPLADRMARIATTRGYGVHSPWAYRFIREVISVDSWLLGGKSRRARLHGRLRDFCGEGSLRVVDLGDMQDTDILRMAEGLGASDILVLEGIHASRENRRRWIGIRDSAVIGITFDLRRFAICFPPCNRAKQHYRLDF